MQIYDSGYYRCLQMSILPPKFPQNMGFLAQIFAILVENYQTRRKFFKILKNFFLGGKSSYYYLTFPAITLLIGWTDGRMHVRSRRGEISLSFLDYAFQSFYFTRWRLWCGFLYRWIRVFSESVRGNRSNAGCNSHSVLSGTVCIQRMVSFMFAIFMKFLLASFYPVRKCGTHMWNITLNWWICRMRDVRWPSSDILWSDMLGAAQP